MRKLSPILFLLVHYTCFSQAELFVPYKADSCQVSIYKVVTKEMMTPQGEEIEKLLNQFPLESKDTKALLCRLAKRSSYQDSRALLTHHNIIFDLYNNGIKSSQIILSTITGNIEIANSSKNEKRFYGNISNKFKKYVSKLLKKYKIQTIYFSRQ